MICRFSSVLLGLFSEVTLQQLGWLDHFKRFDGKDIEGNIRVPWCNCCNLKV
jgi:hypothetical protein